MRLNWKGRPLARDAAVRTCLASQEPPVLEARLAQPRPTPAPHGPHSRAATAATQSGKRRRPVDDDQLRPTSRRRRATDDSLDSCSLSDGYPMSDYEDADEPLYAKPLLAAHKAPLVPSWARELSDDVLREQSTIDPLAVFVDPSEKPVDLRAILGRSPVAPRRKVRARQEALDATSPSQWPSARGGGAPVDICLVVLVAAALLIAAPHLRLLRFCFGLGLLLFLLLCLPRLLLFFVVILVVVLVQLLQDVKVVAPKSCLS